MTETVSPAVTVPKYSLLDLKLFSARLVADCVATDGRRAERITFQLVGEDFDKLVQLDQTIGWLELHKDVVTDAIKAGKHKRRK